MVMYFQDDFMEAINKLQSKEDQDAAIVALVRYHFERSEPTNPMADVVLTLCKDRIELSQKRSKAGAKRKQNKIKTESKSDQNGESFSLSHSHSISNSIGIDNQVDLDGVFDEVEEMEPTFALQCLKAFVDETGRDFKSLPAKCAEFLNSRYWPYSVDDVREMIRYKVDEWEGTKYSKYIQPSTLFSPDHFEEYIMQSKNDEDSKWFEGGYD